MKNEYHNWSGEYEKSYGGSSYNKDERSHYASRREDTTPPKARKEEPAPPKDAGNVSEEPQSQQDQKMKRMKTIYKKLFFAWFFLFILSNVFTWIWNDDSLDEDVQTEETIDDPWGWDDEDLDEELLPVPDDDANDATNVVPDSLETEISE